MENKIHVPNHQPDKKTRYFEATTKNTMACYKQFPPEVSGHSDPCGEPSLDLPIKNGL